MSELSKLWDAFEAKFNVIKKKLDPAFHADADELKAHAEALKAEAAKTAAVPVAEDLAKTTVAAVEQAVEK